MDATLRLNRTETRPLDWATKDRLQPAGPRSAISVPKDGAPCGAAHARIAAIPNPCSPEPRGRPVLPAVPGGPPARLPVVTAPLGRA